eukprot:2721032-Pyramimonas_sp.AAC.1
MTQCPDESHRVFRRGDRMRWSQWHATLSRISELNTDELKELDADATRLARRSQQKAAQRSMQ